MKTRESVLRDAARLFVWYPLRFIIGILPVKTAFTIIDALAFIHFVFMNQGKKRIICANIQKIYPDAEYCSKSMLKKYTRTHYRNQLFIFCIGKINKSERFIIQDSSIELLKPGRSKTGIIVVHPHMHIPQLGLLLLNNMGCKAGQIFHLNEENLSFIGRNVQKKIREKLEKRLAPRMFPADFFIREAVAWLSEGNILLISGDGAGYGRIFGKTIPGTLLGEEYHFPSSYIRIAEKTKSRLLSMEVSENGKYGYLVSFKAFPEGLYSQGIIRWYAGELEKQIRKSPHGWHFLDWKRN